MNFDLQTKKYYSKWIDIANEDLLQKTEKGIHFLYSPMRNEIPLGYSDQIDVYVYHDQRRTFISYGEQAKGRIKYVMGKVHESTPLSHISQILSDVYNVKPSRHFKYVFSGLKAASTDARTLEEKHLEAFVKFFQLCNPNCKNTDWVPEYFLDMASQGFCSGVLRGAALVSCTDAPDMPFMGDLVQEIGIHTLWDFRQRGYAVDACALCIETILKRKKCPIWSTKAENIASQRLAEKLGFEKLGEVLMLSIR